MRILACGIGLFSLAVATSASPPEIGTKAPELVITAIDAPPEAPLSLQDLRGKVVVLEFWATWCAPCIAAIPHLNGLAEELVGEPVVFIAITDESPERVEPFLANRPMQAWVVRDRERTTARSYGVRYLPHTVVISTEGKIAAITSPELLTAEGLRTVARGGKLDLPVRRDVPVEIEWDVAALDSDDSVGHVLLHRSHASGAGMRMRPGSGVIQGDGLMWQVLVQIGWNVESRQVEGDVPSLTDAKYRVSVRSPIPDDEAAREILREFLLHVLPIEVEKVRAERSVLVLRRIEGAEPLAASVHEQASFSGRRGGLELRSARMLDVARMVAGFSGGQLAVDETALDGRYDISISWIAGDRESLNAALAQYGLVLQQDIREIDIVRVRERGLKSSED